MGKIKRIILGTTLAGVVGLGGLVYYDFRPPPPVHHIQIERPKGATQTSGYFNALHIRPQIQYGEWHPCDQYLILNSVKREPAKNRQGWDSIVGEVDLQLGLNCKQRTWEGNNLPLGIFGRDERGNNYLTAKGVLTLKWEGGGREELYVSFGDVLWEKIDNPEKEETIPASFSKFTEYVPSVAKDAVVTVELVPGFAYERPRGQEFYPGFSRKTPLPKSGDYTDRRRAERQLEDWLYNRSGIIVNDRIPVQAVSQEAYESWFRKKINPLMIGNVDRYRDATITEINMNSTVRGLELTVRLTNPTFTEDIPLQQAGFYVRDALNSTGRVIKHYEEPLHFPLKAGINSIPPQYSTQGTTVINKHRSFPVGSRYLLGSLNLGKLNDNSVIVDLEKVGGEPEFKGRFGIRGHLLDLKDFILKQVSQ